MRNELFVLWLLFGSISSATAQVSLEINLPGASIGINQPVYPELVAVPGYPVYYAPQVNSNYFFYDGMYWVYPHELSSCFYRAAVLGLVVGRVGNAA